MAAKVCGSTCAAQPVTTIRASGLLAREPADRLPRLARRLGRHRAGVDDDEIVEPGGLGLARIASDSQALSRQPKVTTSTLISAAPGEQRRREACPRTRARPAGHQDMVVALAPFDRQVAAGQRHRHRAPGEALARGRDQRRAGGRAAGAGEAGAALPDAQHDVVRRRDLRERDIGALGKDRVVLEQRPDLSRS